MKCPDAAAAAVETYANMVGGEATQPLETQIVDLIADLLHLLVENGHSEEYAIHALESGRFHFEYEDTEGYEGEA